MGIATEAWDDENRFNQSGYSAGTLFPVESNYKDKDKFKVDFDRASYRDETHQEFMAELRMEADMEAYYDRMDCDGSE